MFYRTVGIFIFDIPTLDPFKTTRKKALERSVLSFHIQLFSCQNPSIALCSARSKLSNEASVAKIGFDTIENETSEVCVLSVHRCCR